MPNTIAYTKKQKRINGQKGRDGSRSNSVLWNYALEGDQLNGHQFIRKFAIEQYNIDFVCQELKLAINIVQNIPNTENPSEHKKRSLLEKRGYRVLSYTDTEIITKIDEVVSDIFCVAEDLADYYRNMTGTGDFTT